ncbi:uncharacterized protein [Miscanthus floridulus]|uniref:uncharacterized protein n=1 Tax=Miscanthus floridulus TaxID=154761 RepID=UPI00345B41E4
MNNEIAGNDFDYFCLPAVGVAGGAVVSWRRDLWCATSPCARRFSVTTKLTPLNGHGEPWWLTNVYGPTARADKADFLQELRDVRASCPGPWLLCGDFNLIYKASDKNNGRLHHGLMRRFRNVIDDLQLEEIHLSGRLFTWLQLTTARAVIYELDVAQESRHLSYGELELRHELKANVLGLASLARTMARQRSRTRYLKEGDACTKYFHLQACHRRRKNYLFAINHNGQTFSEEEAKAGIVYSYYNELLSKAFHRQHRIDLAQLDLPRLDLSDLVTLFTAEEVARIVRDTPADRAPGPDGFNGAFYKAAWEIVGPDVVRVFHALWELDFRSFYHLNE